MSLDILKLLEDREFYDKHIDIITKNALYSDKHKLIFEDIGKYYSEFENSKQIDWEQFETWFWVKHPIMKSDKKDLYNTILEKLQTMVVDEDLQDNIIQKLSARNYSAQIVDHCLRIVEGEDLDLDKVTTIIEKYHKEVGDLEDDSHIITADVESLLQNTITAGGLNWRLDYLNRTAGPIRKGDLILIGARPETGKTTFLGSEGTHFVSQMKEGQKLIWFNNEEEGQKVKLRIIQAAIGWTSQQMATAGPGAIVKEFERVVGRTIADSILVFDKARITPKDIDRTLDQHDAGVIIFDQLRKVRGFSSASSELFRLAALYQYGREIAKEVAPVIAVHQAGGAAEGVRYIPQDMLEGSKTEIQGELDLQIMIGRSLDSAYENNRFFNIVKNKLSGGPHTIASQRHGKFECYINPEIARYEMPKGLSGGVLDE